MILCFVLIVGGLVLVIKMPEHISAMEKQQKYDNEFSEFADLFTEVFVTIKDRYVKDVPSKQLFEGAINGMFATLDPYSSWMPPDSQEMLTRDTEGEYSGVGLHITLDRHKILTVISPIAGSPGARAGVLPWDRVIEIDGKSTENLGLMEAVKKLTGSSGSKVTIKVWREGQTKPLSFTMVRETIKVESAFGKVIDGDIGYLRISRFQSDTTDSARKQLKIFNEKNVRGVIVDLRFNPGGLLDEAVGLSNLFLPKGQLIVSIKGRTKSNNREYRCQDEAVFSKPLVVMVNHGSASASEIFAGAMKDTHRGVIVGPKGSTTYGKGSVQTISLVNKSFEHDKNGDYRPSGIRLTTALYYTPSGVSIHEKGIKPDVGVALPEGQELLLLRHGLLGDPNQVDPRDGSVGPSLKPNGPDNGKKKTPPSTIMFDNNDEDEPAPGTVSPNAAPDDETSHTTHSLEVILNHQPKAKPAKPENFRDIMLDEAAKYLETVIVAQNSKAA